MALPGFMAELSLRRSITNHRGKKEYESTNNELLFSQRDSPRCLIGCSGCFEGPFNDGKCYRECITADCIHHWYECEPGEPCAPCCPPRCAECEPGEPCVPCCPPGCTRCPPPPPPCTPGCGPCVNGIRHCYTEQCLEYAMACNVQSL